MIYVVGVGFVGLTTALGFAKKNFIVTAVENNNKKIKLLTQNKITFDEPFLKENLKIFLKKKKLILSNQLNLQSKEDNYVFICVGTPEKKNGEVNLKFIKKIILEIDRKFYQCNVLIIIKSTVPPGTITDHLNKIIKNKKNIRIVSNPEFLREGFAWNDFINANKIVIGAEDKKDQLKIKKLYQKFKGEIILTNTKTAEFIKYLSNCLLANLISFSNEMTIFAEKIKNIKVFQSFNSIKLDQRWFGNPANIASYLHPGIGFGGYCLPKDLKAINYLAKKKRISAKLLGSIQEVNKKIFFHQLKKIETTINKSQKICFLGISFKPYSSDLRGSKPLELINALAKKGYKNIEIYDPSISNDEKLFTKKNKIKKILKYNKNNFYILTTAWPEYLKFIKNKKPEKLLDLRYTKDV